MDEGEDLGVMSERAIEVGVSRGDGGVVSILPMPCHLLWSCQTDA